MSMRRSRADRRAPKAATAIRVGALIAAATVVYVLTVSASESSAATLQVCPSGCTYSQIASAVAAAQSGDTVTVAAGTYQGGLTIDVSLKLVGAGAASTIISGGGPVVTIGGAPGSSKLDVSITGVTITGGVTQSSPESTPLYGKAGVLAAGGGVEITPDNAKDASKETPGATVTIANGVITRNSVAPTALSPSPSGVACPSGPCPFASAEGGGIDNSGKLTLTDTTVSDNSAVSTLASDASGGGIENEMGSLTLVDSTVSGNQSGVMAPNGRFADSGGISAVRGIVAIRSSSLTNNRATVTVSWPNSVDTEGHAGAMHVMAGTATISDTKIVGNSVSITNKVGSAFADSGGLKTDVPIKLNSDVIANNRVTVTTLGGPSAGAQGDSGAGELIGTVTNTRLIGNSVTISSAKGSASASSGASLIEASLTDSVVQDNQVHATSAAGAASAVGGGIHVSGGAPGMPVAETLRNTPVSDNTAEATGRSATAEGGGIFDISIPNGPPGGQVTLVKSSVTHNTVSASPKGTLKDGGVFTTFKITLTSSAISANTPDQCSGNGC